MSNLNVRVYNVLFGDAVLLSVPDIDATGQPIVLKVLIDCGNALAGKAGDDAVFKPVLTDIASELGGKPLDLYIMTHEHMDHVQGMLYGAQKLGININARQVWMTASSAPDYYDAFPKAREQRKLALSVLDETERFLAASPGGGAGELEALMGINNPRASADCIDCIRAMAPGDPLYVHREANIAGRHPFRKTSIRVLAPEQDTSVYYGRLGPRTLGMMVDTSDPFAGGNTMPQPPAGVSAGHFYDLVKFRSSGLRDNLLQIDKAANNTSLVLEFEWNGWRLLFPGDAEEKSWAIMERLDLLSSAHFLKVSHHGSHNGTPPEVTDKVLPEAAPDEKPRIVVVSTAVGAYKGVPDDETLNTLAQRATLHDTRNIAPGKWFDFVFEPN
ncbi:MAG: hypothetical protein HEQ16_09410 [Bosea sp.]|nr:hypothetical protein [Bosea sp. (in: a-proteobacteria)]